MHEGDRWHIGSSQPHRTTRHVCRVGLVSCSCMFALFQGSAIGSRGDNSVDTSTCEIHCHLHMLVFGDPMPCQPMQGAQQLELWQKRREEKSKEAGKIPVVVETPVWTTMSQKLPHFRHRTGPKVLCSVDRSKGEGDCGHGEDWTC
jgi:hypothetical protein